MKSRILAIGAIALGMILVASCGPSPTRTPAATLAPQIITVIVTATPPPATEIPVQPPPTQPAVVAITTTVPVSISTATAVATKAGVAVTKPTATKKPVVAAATATATALPLKYAAPPLLRPRWTDDQKDERKFDTDSVEFVWRPADGIAPGECYLLALTSTSTNPASSQASKSDSFLARCADQPRTDEEVKFGEVRFTLYSPKIGGPNYTSIKLDTNEMWVDWTVTVVKNLGQCEAGNIYHCKTQPLSPAGKARFLFKGG